MKVIKYILPLLSLGLIVAACNSDDEESIAATEIQNLTTQSAPGSITLTWEYAGEEDDNMTRLVEIRYYDPAVKKNVKKTASRFSNSFKIMPSKDMANMSSRYNLLVQLLRQE